MSMINLYFVTIPGKRIFITLPEDFELTDMLHMIRNKMNDTTVENCIFFCKGRRLSMDDPMVFQNQKRKLINNGDVILVGKKMLYDNINQTTINYNKVTYLQRYGFFLSTNNLIFFYLERIYDDNIFHHNEWKTNCITVENSFGKYFQQNSRFICMGEELSIHDQITFERQKSLIRDRSVILHTVQNTKTIQQNEHNQLLFIERNIFQKFYIILTFLFFLIFYT
uniref:Ubiquitin-like domain-containing protein n=1 Tax=Adineta vaga TaxID=104782 RepID=D4NWF8_ADIVA|nr:hypothetical protein [Adineta vaga]